MERTNNKHESKEIQKIFKSQKEFDSINFNVKNDQNVRVPIPMKHFVELVKKAFVSADMKEEVKVLIYDYMRLYLMENVFGEQLDEAITEYFTDAPDEDEETIEKI